MFIQFNAIKNMAHSCKDEVDRFAIKINGAMSKLKKYAEFEFEITSFDESDLFIDGVDNYSITIETLGVDAQTVFVLNINE